MLKPETYQLEAVVGEIFLSNAERQPDFFDGWQNRVSGALRELRTRLQNQYLNTAKERSLQRYFRYHRSVLTSLSNDLLQHVQSNFSPHDDRSKTLNGVLEQLESLLKDDRAKHPDLFDSSEAVTRFRHDQESRSMADALTAIECDRSDLHGLLAVIRSSYEDLTGPAQVTASHEELVIRWQFIAIIQTYLQRSQADPTELFWLLYRENFNGSKLAVWYQQQLLQHLDQSTGRQAERRLNEEAQRSLVTGNTPKTGFDPRRVSITEVLPAWLIQVRVKYGLYTIPGDRSYRLPLKVSVAHLGYNLRLCFLTGCFEEENVSEVLRFFAQHFTSKKQDHISKKSLAKAFYSAEQSTAASVRARLLRMIDHINKKYFPK